MSEPKFACIVNNENSKSDELQIEDFDEEKCYEIIEIEVLSKEETNDFLQDNENEQTAQSSELNNLDFLEFQTESEAENEHTNLGKSKSPSNKAKERTCSVNCTFQCRQYISENERQLIHDNFEKLSAPQKKRFYNKFIRNYQYYLPIFNGSLQVCSTYFFSTLNVTKQMVFQHFDQQYENGQLECEGYKLQEVKDHICRCLADDLPTASKMYKLYKEKYENPVDIKTYKRVFKELCAKINNAAIALENQIEMEDESASDDYSSPAPSSHADFQNIFEAQAFSSRENSEDVSTLNFENDKCESDFANQIFDADTSCINAKRIEGFQKTHCDDFKKEVDLSNDTLDFFEDEKMNESEIGLQNDVPKPASYGHRSQKIRKRLRNPELWQQNVRKELCQKGQPYCDRFGVARAGKSVGDVCVSSCTFVCTKEFPYEARERIHTSFWSLSTFEKRNFLATYVQKVEIKKRRKSQTCKEQKEPRKKNSFRYFLPKEADTIRVCKFFFLQTLAISEAKIHYYYDTYHNNEVAKSLSILPGRGRKSTLKIRLQAVREHVKSFSADTTLSMLKMYELYKAQAENPVGIDAYRRVRIKYLKANSNNENTLPMEAHIESLNDQTNDESNSRSLHELTENVIVEEAKNDDFCEATELTEDESIEHIFEEYISSGDDNEESVEETENIFYDEDLDIEVLPHDASESNSKRSRQPELWKQNVRIKRRQKGLPYVDRNGVERPAKSVGPACHANCIYMCTNNFSNRERQRIHAQFWSLTTQGKQNFFETYVEMVNIKKRTKPCETQDEPKKKKSLHYYFPQAGKLIRVCKFYFLKTLAISDARVLYHFEKYHNDIPKPPRPGRKSLSRSRMKEVEDHVNSFPVDKKLSAARMYKSYKAISENPVSIDIYRRVKQDILGGFRESSSKTKDVALKPTSSAACRTNRIRKRIPNRKRTLGPPCDAACCHSCTSKISKEKRTSIHKEFWKLNKEEQQEFFGNYIQLIKIKQRSKECELVSKKQQSFSYNLPVNDENVRVCRKYFLSTLAVSETRLYYFFNQQKQQ